MVVPKANCVVCEMEGVTTELIPFSWFRICPVHSPHRHAAAREQVEPGPESDPLLLGRGRPSWPHRQAA